MFENHHPGHYLVRFLTHKLNTSVFSSLTQTQISALFQTPISKCGLHAAMMVMVFKALIDSCRLKFDQEQFHIHKRR